VTYDVRLSRQAKRALVHDLPEEVAAACFEFIYGPLAENPTASARSCERRCSGSTQHAAATSASSTTSSKPRSSSRS
jgi:hypothetical protein